MLCQEKVERRCTWSRRRDAKMVRPVPVKAKLSAALAAAVLATAACFGTALVIPLGHQVCERQKKAHSETNMSCSWFSVLVDSCVRGTACTRTHTTTEVKQCARNENMPAEARSTRG